MKYLITGANGFIGSNLATKLKKSDPNSDIYLLDLRFNNPLLDGLNFGFLNCNLLKVSENELPDVDVVIHAAALLGVGYVNSNPLSVILSNISAFGPLVKYITNPSVKFVFFSTSEIYGDGAFVEGNNTVYRENNPDQQIPLPDLSSNRSSYALSKIVGEFISSRSVDYLCVRPHNIYGPNMGTRHVIPNLIEKTKNAINTGTIEVFNPTHVRSFCYIDDAVSQILNLLKKDVSGNYNIGNPQEPIEIIELTRKILSLMKVEAKIDFNNQDIGSPMYRKPVINHWEEDYIDLDFGLRQMIDYYAHELI